jgi:ABC-type sugar transport system ATPase subunit
MMISHNLNDVFEVADRIAVLHLGRMVAQDVISAFDRQTVVEYLTFGGQKHLAAVPTSTEQVSDGGAS